MQRRPWVIVVSLLVFALAFSFLVTIRYLNRSDRLRQEIMSALSNVPGQLSIGRAVIAATTLQISDVVYENPDKSLHVIIDRMSVRFTLGNWLTHEGGVESLVESITVVNPSISYRPSAKSEKEKSELPDVSRYAFLRRAILRNGSFELLNESGTPLIGFNNLDGWLLSGEENVVQIQIMGSLFGEQKQNLQIKGTFDLASLALESELNLSDYSLKEMELSSSSRVKDFEGTISANSRLRWNPDQWSLTGNLQVVNGGFRVVKGPTFSNIEVSGLAEDGLLTLGGTLDVEGDQGSLDAAMTYRSPLALSSAIHVPEMRLGEHLGTFLHMRPGLRPKGLVDATTGFRWDAEQREWNWTIEGTSASLETPIGSFSDVAATMHWDRENRGLVFDSLYSRWHGMEVVGSGNMMPWAETRMALEANINGKVDPEELPKWAGPVASKTTTANMTLKLVRDEGWLIDVGGRVRDDSSDAVGDLSYTYRNTGSRVNLELYSRDKRNATFVMDMPRGGQKSFSLKDPQTLAQWWDNSIQLPGRLDKVEIETSFKLYPDKITGSAAFFDEQTELNLEIYGTVATGDSLKSGELSYKVSRQEFGVGYGDLELSYQDKYLTISQLTFMDYFSLIGRVDFAKKQIDEFDLVIHDLELGELIPGITAVAEGRIGGTLGGRMSVSGSFQRPKIDSHFEFYDGRYGDLKQYWGVLTLATNLQGDVYVQQGMLGRGGTTILSMHGGYNVPDDQFDLRLEAPRTDARLLAEAIAGKPELLEGPIALSGRLTGSMKFPSWIASLSMVDAKVAGILFDDVNVDIRGQTNERFGHVLYVDKFSMQRGTKYTMSASGAAPLSRGAGQLSARLEGAIFELLSQRSSIISDARGNGIIDWTVTIVAGKPAATNGVIRVDNGMIAFDKIFPKLHDIFVDVEVSVDGTTNINRLDGVFADDQSVKIRNEAGNNADLNRTPIIIENLGLNLGVLKLSTPSSRGIPIHIPNVILSKEFAQVRFTGKNGDPWFRVSGPVDSLRLDGQMSLANAQITFPPLTNGDAGTNRVRRAEDTPRAGGFMSLLSNARWSTDFQVMQNVHYERDIAGLQNSTLIGSTVGDIFSQIYLDLTVEPTEPSRPLKLSGRAADKSFRLDGELVSKQGSIELLDMNFEMQEAELIWDPSTILPMISAKAVTYVVEESYGTESATYSRELFLTLYVIDPETNERTTRGRWGEFTFVLEDEQGSSQEEVLGALGYDAQSLTERAAVIGAEGVERALIRRWLRPIERDIARVLGLDLVKINPAISSYLMRDYMGGGTDSTGLSTGNINQLRSSSVKVGKYILPNLFVSYTGQLGGDPAYQTNEMLVAGQISYLQSWDLEYRVRPISPNLVLQGEYEYDNIQNIENPSVSLKYTLVYDLTKISFAKMWRNLWN